MDEKEYLRQYYQRNKERIKARVSARIKNNPKFYEQQLACNRIGSAKRRGRLITAMGGCCSRCGFNDYRALQIDHVYGGGGKDPMISHISERALLIKLDKFRNGELQLLCANCNWIKRAENNETSLKRVS